MEQTSRTFFGHLLGLGRKSALLMHQGHSESVTFGHKPF